MRSDFSPSSRTVDGVGAESNKWELNWEQIQQMPGNDSEFKYMEPGIMVNAKNTAVSAGTDMY